MTPPIVTLGYEARTAPAMADELKAAGVEVLIDVRAVASSRKAGFSKSILAATLAERGIEYVHLKGLGTPKAGRDAARAGRAAEMRAIYDAHLENEPQAQADLHRAADIAAGRRAALLCLEADPACCHRTLVAERLRALAGFQVVEL